MYSAAGNSAGVYDRDDQFFLRVRLGPHGDVRAHGIIRGEGFLLVAQGPITAEFDEDGAIRSLVVTYKDPRAGGRAIDATIRTTGGTDDQGRHLAMLSVPGYSIPWPYVVFL